MTRVFDGEECRRNKTIARALEAWNARVKTWNCAARRQTAGFTPPRGTPNQFWAGLLTRLRPPPAPSHADTPHSGICRNRQAYSSGGLCRSVRKNGVTGFPFHPPHDCGARNLKRLQVYAEAAAKRKGFAPAEIHKGRPPVFSLDQGNRIWKLNTYHRDAETQRIRRERQKARKPLFCSNAAPPDLRRTWVFVSVSSL